MKLQQLTEAAITKTELDKLEKILDDLFSKVGIDVEWHGHFFDRVNDPRNGKDITIKELQAMFNAVFKKYGEVISKQKTGYEGLIFDINSKINIPFILKYSKEKKELELIAKTVMRKQDFKTRTKKYKVNT